MAAPGEVVALGGAAADLLAAVARLEGRDFALVGGLAVMIRLNGNHRVTNDLDSVFNNSSSDDTTTILVSAGIATDDDAPQRVLIDGTKLDVIDTEPLPPNAADLPDEPKDRLFVCAHRWAYESAQPVTVATDTTRATIRVATPAALVACKSHALRFATSQRRSLKRPSDLYDTYRLARQHADQVTTGLVGAPWGLGGQVFAALDGDLTDLPQATATIRSSPSPAISATDPDDFEDVITGLLAGLRPSP